MCRVGVLTQSLLSVEVILIVGVLLPETRRDFEGRRIVECSGSFDQLMFF